MACRYTMMILCMMMVIITIADTADIVDVTVQGA